MDTLLYDISIPAISSLQNSLADHSSLMQALSVIFDPKYAFLIYSPLAYLLDPKVGKQLIMTTVLAEWMNQILKWFLHGERPYWYVHSSGHFDPQQTPIKQFPITCELGPGHPSGHAMLTASVWYIILSSLLQAYRNYHNSANGSLDREQHPDGQQIQKDQQPQPQPQAEPVLGPATITTWTVYASLLALVSVSRVFLGCHFPHQCLVGALLGLVLARWVSGKQTRATHFILASVLLFVTAFATFGLLDVLGLDPNWTIRLATKHCTKREYIHLDTAPFFSIMRYCGFALGTGLGLLLPLKSYAKQLIPDEGHILVDDGTGKPESPLSPRNVSWLSVKLIMALLMARLVDNLGVFVSHANLPLFYSGAFAAYTTFSYAFINL